jgi:hypothetical protein
MIRTLIKEQMGIGILCRLDILDEIESGQFNIIEAASESWRAGETHSASVKGLSCGSVSGTNE